MSAPSDDSRDPQEPSERPLGPSEVELASSESWLDLFRPEDEEAEPEFGDFDIEGLGYLSDDGLEDDGGYAA